MTALKTTTFVRILIGPVCSLLIKRICIILRNVLSQKWLKIQNAIYSQYYFQRFRTNCLFNCIACCARQGKIHFTPALEDVGTLPPSGSISRRFCPYLLFSSLAHFLQIIFGIVQPSISWLSSGSFSVWDMPKHFLDNSFVWHFFNVFYPS